jgi:hypothetical protein
MTDDGPIVARWRGVWRYRNGRQLEILAQVAAGDSRVLFETTYSGDSPNDGWEFLNRPGIPGDSIS